MSTIEVGNSRDTAYDWKQYIMHIHIMSNNIKRPDELCRVLYKVCI